MVLEQMIKELEEEIKEVTPLKGNARDEIDAFKQKLLALRNSGIILEQEILEKLNYASRFPYENVSYFWFMAARLAPSSKYINTLCKLLEIESEPLPDDYRRTVRNKHMTYEYETIVEIMMETPDESMIPSLKKLLGYEFSEEEGYAPVDLYLKIMKILYQINTDEAWEIIETLAALKAPALWLVQEMAENIIENRKNSDSKR